MTAVGIAQLLLRKHLPLQQELIPEAPDGLALWKASCRRESCNWLRGNTLTCGFNVLNASLNKNRDWLLRSHDGC